MFLMVMGNMALPTAACVLLFLLARQSLAGPKWMPFALSALVAATGTGLFFAADLLLFQPGTETASNLFSRDYLGWLRWIGIATILLPIHDWWANR